jgi:hypothetical protein
MYIRAHSHAFIKSGFLYHLLRTIAVSCIFFLALFAFLLFLSLTLASRIPSLESPGLLRVSSCIIHELTAANSTVSYSPFL